MLECDLQTTSSSLEVELRKGAEKEDELSVLRNCLQQVMGPRPDKENGTGDGEQEEVDGEGNQEAALDKEAQIKKIEAMLDTTKVSRQGWRVEQREVVEVAEQRWTGRGGRG
jgi:hypothetical protein